MMTKDKTIGSVLLLITALIWGIGFSIGHIGMGILPMYMYSGLRCFLAGISLMCYIWVKEGLKCPSLNTIKGGVACGVALFVASSLQNYGIVYSSAGKTSFITSLYIVFVPIINLFIFKTKISKKIIVCILLAIIGMYFLSFSRPENFDYTDLVVLISAVAYAVHIVVIAYWVKRADPTEMSCIQMWINGALALTVSLIFEKQNVNEVVQALPALLYSGVMGTGVGFTLQINAQKLLPAELATIIMSLESVFGAIFGYIILNQKLSNIEILGCVIVFIAVILVEIFGDTQQKTREKRK